MNEITLLEAIHMLRMHKSKRQRLVFKVTFDEGITRIAHFGKYWNKVTKSWTYVVQDGEHAPVFAYSERLAVSAIMSIKGMDLYFNSIRYHISLCDDTQISS